MQIKRTLLAAGFAAACCAAVPMLASAASDTDQPGKHDTAKGAAIGAVAGHEVGSGHALAGAAVGAGIGHHEKKKAEKSAASNQ